MPAFWLYGTDYLEHLSQKVKMRKLFMVIIIIIILQSCYFSKVNIGLVHPLKSFNPLWIQIHHLFAVLQGAYNIEGFKNKLSVLFKGKHCAFFICFLYVKREINNNWRTWLATWKKETWWYKWHSWYSSWPTYCGGNIIFIG